MELGSVVESPEQMDCMDSWRAPRDPQSRRTGRTLCNPMENQARKKDRCSLCSQREADLQTASSTRRLRCRKRCQSRPAWRVWRFQKCPRQIQIAERSYCNQDKPSRYLECRDLRDREYSEAHRETPWIVGRGTSPEYYREYRVAERSTHSVSHNSK